jgi:hypothetical protein
MVEGRISFLVASATLYYCANSQNPFIDRKAYVMTHKKVSANLAVVKRTEILSRLADKNSAAIDPLTPAQRNFAELLGRLLVQEWEA